MILSNFITIWNDKEFDMDKRDYELLLALDQHKNITKAAQSLYMTQPAITKRIQKMEEELHCPLLIRSKRGVLLTPAAESLLPCARTILKNMEQMEELAAASQDYICGTLRLGCSLNYAHYRLPAILKDYTDRYPKVEVHITTEQSRQLYKMLCKEEISLAILRGEYNWDGKKILLASEPMCLICRGRRASSDRLSVHQPQHRLRLKFPAFLLVRSAWTDRHPTEFPDRQHRYLQGNGAVWAWLEYPAVHLPE